MNFVSVPGGYHLQARENISGFERDIPSCDVLRDTKQNYVHCTVDVTRF